MFQISRHSESLEKYYELANSYFSCYSESINADEKLHKVDETQNNVILNFTKRTGEERAL